MSCMYSLIHKLADLPWEVSGVADLSWSRGLTVG